MGFLNLISKAAEYLVPTVLDTIFENNNRPEGCSEDTNELIRECLDFLSIIEKIPIEDNEEILKCFDNLDRRLLKLEKIDSNSENDLITDDLETLNSLRDKAFDKITNKYNEVINRLLEETKAENNPEIWAEKNEELDKYMRGNMNLTKYNADNALRFADYVNDFINS